MIVIPMCGESSRFFSQGFDVPKYQLMLNNKSIFSHVINGFSNYFDEDFLFIIKKDYYNTSEFIEREIKSSLPIKNYKIVELDFKTTGQAHTVMCGLSNEDPNQRLIIFNIDTIRKNINIPEYCTASNVNGFLEVVKASGNNWSFVKPTYNKGVLYTAEKERISTLCSTGLYGFKTIKLFKSQYATLEKVHGEHYISPMYNYMYNIKYYKIKKKDFIPVGTPEEFYDCVATKRVYYP